MSPSVPNFFVVHRRAHIFVRPTPCALGPRRPQPSQRRPGAIPFFVWYRIPQERVGVYRVFFLLCRKVWKMKSWKVPSAVRLILQLPTAHAGRWNFPKCPLPNLATEQKKHSVHDATSIRCALVKRVEDKQTSCRRLLISVPVFSNNNKNNLPARTAGYRRKPASCVPSIAFSGSES